MSSRTIFAGRWYAHLDRYASGLARAVLAPPFPLPAALDLLRATERTGVAATIRRLDERCRELEPFAKAAPERQPDAVA